MKELRYSLLSDGSSDRALIPILTWLLRQHVPDTAIQPEWADLRHLPRPPRDLPERIQTTLEYYPCDLLFIHRDAESAPLQTRIEEICEAIKGVNPKIEIPFICVVPVRMQEAWLMFDSQAIRRAAGNPSGKKSLDLPPLREVEDIRDPKKMLYRLLREAVGLHGRRLKQSRPQAAVQRIPEFIDDFSPLRTLPAFRHLEDEIMRFGRYGRRHPQ